MKSATYYVSSLTGNDSNNGLSPQFPFATLNKINEASLQPGDRVLLEKGSVFSGQYLHIKNCGDYKKELIEIGAYGEGALPRIDADGNGIWYQDYGCELDSPAHIYKGNVSSAILLYDTENILIRDIEITNFEEYTTSENYSAAHKTDRTGVAAVAKNRGTLHNITLCGLYIHDINGNVYNKHMNNGGIYMTAFKPDNEKATGVARYDGVTVKDCFVQNVSRWGIAVGYTYCHAEFTGAELEEEIFKKYGHENILLKNNYVKSAGGDAITPMYALRPLVEHNTADSCAMEMNDRIYRYPESRMGKVAAAIWPWKCKNALFKFNEVADTRLNQDGMAYDADSGDGTVYEYNYSSQNEGGCIMFCLEEAIHNTFKNNISFDDLGGILSPAGNPDAYVAENQFFIRKGVPLIRESMCDGNITLKDNKITVIENK
ncbi:MAG: polyhydroxyalkanoate depolymerase [Eubacterium sp.]